MDGNGRWAQRQGLARTAGHTAGEENLAHVVRLSVARHVDHLTVFGFSTENWVRPRQEVRHILGLHEKLFGRLDELNANNVRVRWIGRRFEDRRSKTPRHVQRAILRAIDETRHNTGMTLTVAFDYGSRAEIADAARRLVSTHSDVTIEALSAQMYDVDLPPVDVMVRTSGEMRVSNFLLWQAVGSAIYFTENTWPEFDAADLDAALALGHSRHRSS